MTDALADVARRALAAYELPGDAALRPLRLTNNAVFEVALGPGQRHVLRVHRPHYRTPAHTRSELQFLAALDAALAGTAIRVPRPIAACDGRLVVEVGGPDATRRHCDLLSWIDGRVLRPTRGLGPQAAHLLGEALGRIHAFGARFRPPPGFELPRWDAAAMFGETSRFGQLAGAMSPAAWALVQRVAERTAAVFDQLRRAGADTGLVHADFILGNCHFVRRNRAWQVGVLDFDDLGHGYLLYDLCPLLGNLLDFPGYPRLRAAFLDGYRRIRRLPRALEAHLPVLMAARHAVSCAWVVSVHHSNGGGPPIREHVATRLAQIRDCLALADR